MPSNLPVSGLSVSSAMAGAAAGGIAALNHALRAANRRRGNSVEGSACQQNPGAPVGAFDRELPELLCQKPPIDVDVDHVGCGKLLSRVRAACRVVEIAAAWCDSRFARTQSVPNAASAQARGSEFDKGV